MIGFKQLAPNSASFEDMIGWYTTRSGLLFETYKDYVTNPSMAADIRMVGLLMAIIHTTHQFLKKHDQVVKLYETGTGLSTIMIENYVQHYDKPDDYLFHKHSEDNKQWLFRLRAVAEQLGITLDHVVTPDALWELVELKKQWILFLDGKADHRPADLRQFSMGAVRGLILIDDANRAEIREAAKRFLSQERGALYDLKAITKDEHGRYGWLWVGEDFFMPIEMRAWIENNGEVIV